MAGIRRYGSAYHVDFRYQGKRYQRSLETECQSEAKRLKAIIEQTLKDLTRGVVTLPSNPTIDQLFQFLISGGKVSRPESVQSSLTLGQVCEIYRSSQTEDSKEESTLKTEIQHLNNLCRVLRKNTPLTEITIERLEAYVAKRKTEKGIRGRNVQPATISKELQTFSQLWTFALDRELVIGTNPCAKIRKPRRNQKMRFMAWDEIDSRINRGGLTESEIVDLWDALFLREREISLFLRHVKSASAGFRAYPYIFPALAFCAYTGARRSEMFRCLVDDVSDTILIREKKRQRDKKISFREVPLHPELGRILAEWQEKHPGGQFYFCKNSGNPLDDKTSRKAFQAVTRESKWSVLRGYHVLRHSFASNLAKHGVEQYQIDELMGHQTEEMRQRYRHLFPEDRKKAIAVLSYA